MKYFFTICCGLLALNAFSQIQSGVYKGLERMCWTNEKGKIKCYDSPRKWYHLNILYIDKDSVFIYKSPVVIEKKDTIHSASDGAFYYYLGVIKQTDTGNIVHLTMNNCDYCAKETFVDTATGFMYPVSQMKKFKITDIQNGLKMDNVNYFKLENSTLSIPPRQFFYFDSNSIYRVNPKVQYSLISTGIKNFLETKNLKLDKDTLRICIERYNDNKMIDKLNPDLLNIDTSDVVLKFYKLSELKSLVQHSAKPIRFIDIRQIIDYWKEARISLTYKILLPPNVHNFREREYNALFEYEKVGTTYKLVEGLPENGWSLLEKK